MTRTITKPIAVESGAHTATCPDDAIALLHDLVATPSVSGRESRAAELLASRMNRMGYRARVDESGSAVGVRGDDPHAPGVVTIALVGHIDTVPGDLPVRIENGVLHGRGSVDAKGPLATFTVAGAAAELPPGIALVVIGATEEEAASSRGARHATTIYKPAACLIGEPSAADGITLGYKGRLLVRVTATTPAQHSAGPGLSGPDAAFEWWRRVHARCDERDHAIIASRGHRPSPFHRVQSRILSCTSSADDHADRAVFECGFRIPPEVSPREIEAWCRDAAEAMAPEAAIALELEGAEVAVMADRSNPVVRALAASMRDHGVRPRYKLKTGTSDMNVVAPVWNCPIAAYGPGDSTLDHTPHEHLRISEYLHAIDILRGALEHLAASIAPEAR